MTKSLLFKSCLLLLLFLGFQTQASAQSAQIVFASDTLNTGDSASYCAGVFIPVNALTAGFTGSETYLWSVSGALIFNPVLKSTSVKFANVGVYQLNFTVFANDTVTTSVYITVLPPIVAPQLSAAQNICYNAAPQTLALSNASGGNSVFTYHWYYSNNGSTNWQSLGHSGTTFTDTALQQNRWYRVLAQSLCTDVYSNIVKITVAPVLDTLTTTANNTAICKGGTSSVTVVNPNAGLNLYTYAWQQKPINDTIWVAVPNSGNTLTLITPAITQAMDYRALVTSCGQSIYTTASRIRLNLIVVDSVAHQGNDTICANTTNSLIEVYFSVNNSSNVNYIWYRISGTAWTQVGTTKTYNAAQQFYSSSKYRCVVYNTGCFSNADTSSALWIYKANTFYGANTSGSQAVCYNQAPTPITRSQPNILGVQQPCEWQTAPTVSGPWTSTGILTSPLLLGNLTSDIWFRVATTQTVCGTQTVYSAPQSVTVLPVLMPGTLMPDTSVVCTGTSVTLNLGQSTGAKTPYKYKWEYAPLYAPTWIKIPFTDSATTSYIFQNPQQSFKFRVIITTGCSESDTSNVGVVVVYKSINGGKVVSKTGRNEVCPGMPAPTLKLINYSGGIGTYDFEWYKKLGTGSWYRLIGNADSLVDVMPITQTTMYKVKVFDTGQCGSSFSDSIAITESNIPGTGIAIQGSTVVCKGQQNVYFQLQPAFTDSVHWQFANATFINNGTDRVLLNMNANYTAGYDTIYARLIDRQSFCEHTLKLPVFLNANPSPLAGNIKYLAATNALLYSDSLSGLGFQWGTIERATGYEAIFANSNTHRFLLPSALDTSTYLYFIKVTNFSCRTTVVFQSNAKPFDIAEVGTHKQFTVFPNPNNGHFKIDGPVDQIVAAQLVNSGGIVFQLNTKMLSDHFIMPRALPNGLYILVLTTQFGVETTNIILQR